MYLIKRSIFVSLWFVFLTLPLLVVRVDTTNDLTEWQPHTLIYVAVAAFVLYLGCSLAQVS